MGTPGDQSKHVQQLPQIIEQPNEPAQSLLSSPQQQPTYHQSLNMPNVSSRPPIPTLHPDIVVKPETTILAELEPSIIDVEAGPSGLQLRLGGDTAKRRLTRKVSCQKVFPSTSSAAAAALQPFKCEHCKKTFTSKFKLVRHALIHSDRRPFSCTVCNRTFHRKDHLKNHCKVHDHSKELHVCAKADCNKEYTSHLSYKKHLALHAAEEGNLTCQLCHKAFRSKDEVLMHLKVHAGTRPVKNPDEKKYRCDSCDRRFFTRKDVRRHEVVHTGMRNFLCQFCPERFGRKDHLIRHIKKLHHQQQSTLDQQQQQQLAATTLIKLEVPVVAAAPTYYHDDGGGGMDFLFSAAAVDDGEEGMVRRRSSSDCRVEEFKNDPPPLEDLGSNVLEDIAGEEGGSSSSSRDVAAASSACNEDDIDIESSSPVDVDLEQLLQQTGKLPAFDQIFQLSAAPQQQQQQPPDS